MNADSSKTGYTPGPWKAERYHGEWVVSADHMCSFPGRRFFITDRVGGDERDAPTKGTPEANARLIAAAPALVEALKGMMGIVKDSRGVAGYHSNGDTAEWDKFDEVDQADAAFRAAGVEP